MFKKISRKNIQRYTWVLLFACLCSFQRSFAQNEVPAFDVDYVGVRNGSTSQNTRVDLYTKIAYANLNFINQNNKFESHYEVNADIYRVGTNGKPTSKVKSEVWERRVSVPQYEPTQSDIVFDFATHSINLSPDYYVVQLTVEDKNSQRTFLKELPLHVRNFNNKTVSMSDILVVDEYNPRRNTISPNVSNVIENNQDKVSFFYEVYSEQGQEVEVAYNVDKVVDSKEKSVLKTILGIQTEEIEPSQITNWKTQDLKLKEGRNAATVSVPLDEFKAGTYTITITIQDASKNLLDSAVKLFNVQWAGLQAQLNDIEKATSQLVYVAKKAEIEYIKGARNETEKLQRFKEFWGKRDPSPGTQRNEVMEEYYYRVKNASDKYGILNQEGWRTDQGEVYIRFGEPSYIQYHPYNFGSSKAYEIWYYNNIGRRYIFIDETGVGDYRLLRPIWDERNRM